MWIIYKMEYYSACKNKDIKNFAGKWIHLDTHILINNKHNVQDIHAAFLGSEETKQEERLRS